MYQPKWYVSSNQPASEHRSIIMHHQVCNIVSGSNRTSHAQNIRRNDAHTHQNISNDIFIMTNYQTSGISMFSGKGSRCTVVADGVQTFRLHT